MNFIFTTFFAIIMLTSLSPTEGWARQAPRSGFWIEAGVGTGVTFINCHSCKKQIRAYGQSAYLRVGGAFSERVLWGVELLSLLSATYQPTLGDDVLDVEINTVTPVVLWYPWRIGFFVKGGVGLSRGEIKAPETETNPNIVTSGVGSGMTFGIGIDLPITSRLAITANLGTFVGAVGDVVVQDIFIDDIISTVYNVNLGITVR